MWIRKRIHGLCRHPGGISVSSELKTKQKRRVFLQLAYVGVVGQLLVAPVGLGDVVFLGKLLCITQLASSHSHNLKMQFHNKSGFPETKRSSSTFVRSYYNTNL